jgi:hypothetical protein
MNLRKEVRELISVNEKIQSTLLRGDYITDDEAILIRQCALELLEKVPLHHPKRQHAARSSEAIRAVERSVEGDS